MKKILPGTLNPLYECNSPIDIDVEELNNPYYAQEMEKKLLETELEQDLFSGMKLMKAIILGPAKFSFDNTATDYAMPVHAGTKPTNGNMRVWYHFRIPELHAHLPDPCDPRLLKDKAGAQAAMYDHPIAPYIRPDLNVHPTQMLPGTIVEVQFDRGPSADLQLFPKIVKELGPSYGMFNVDAECQSMLNAYAESVGYETLGVSGGGTLPGGCAGRSFYGGANKSSHTIQEVQAALLAERNKNAGSMPDPPIASEALLSFIGAGEGDYNSMNQGTKGNKIIGSTNDASTILGKNLTEMTMKEVLKFQSKGKLFAAGRYQIIPDTMKSSMRRAGVTESDIFNKTTQDRLGSSLIYGNKREDLRDYLIGKSDDIDAANLDFAKEWASVPSPGPCKGEPGSLV